MAAGFGQHGMPRPSVTLTFDRLTLKLVCELHVRWGIFIKKFGHARPLRSRIIRYVCDGRTDTQTDEQTDGQKQRLLPSSLQSGA